MPPTIVHRVRQPVLYRAKQIAFPAFKVGRARTGIDDCPRPVAGLPDQFLGLSCAGRVDETQRLSPLISEQIANNAQLASQR